MVFVVFGHSYSKKQDKLLPGYKQTKVNVDVWAGMFYLQYVQTIQRP